MVWPKDEWLWLSPAPTAPGESGLSHVTESLQPTKLNVILAPVWQAANGMARELVMLPKIG
jgi:hypothetical protein